MSSRAILIVALSLFLPGGVLVFLGGRALMKERVVLERELDAEAERVGREAAGRAAALFEAEAAAFRLKTAGFDGSLGALATLRAGLAALPAERGGVTAVFLRGPDGALLEPEIHRFPAAEAPADPGTLERFLRLRRSAESLMATEGVAPASVAGMVRETVSFYAAEAEGGRIPREQAECFRATLLLDLASFERLKGESDEARTVLREAVEVFPAARDLEGMPVEFRSRLLLAETALGEGRPEEAAGEALSLLGGLAEDRFLLTPPMKDFFTRAAGEAVERALSAPGLAPARREALLAEKRSAEARRDFLALLEGQILAELDALSADRAAADFARVVKGRSRLVRVERLAAGHVAGVEVSIDWILSRLAREIEGLAAGAAARIEVRGPDGLALLAAGRAGDDLAVRDSRPLASFLPSLTIETALGGKEEEVRLARLRLFVYGAALGLSAALLLGGLMLTVRAVGQKMRLAQLRTDFVRNVSHELRTPLTAIRMYGEILLDGGLPAAKQREYFRVIVAESERLQRLVEQVLDFARLERGALSLDRRPTDLGALVGEAVETFRYQVEPKGFEVRFETAEDLPLVSVDREAVRRVLQNLLVNAVKYSREERVIDVAVGEAGGRVYAAVKDRGIGISPEDRRRLFAPFQRIEREGAERRSGFGLGLVLALELAKLHGGTIEVESEPGRGSTFTLWLPAIAGALGPEPGEGGEGIGAHPDRRG